MNLGLDSSSIPVRLVSVGVLVSKDIDKNRQTPGFQFSRSGSSNETRGTVQGSGTDQFSRFR